MKTNGTSKANYRLAARLRGNELELRSDLREAMRAEHLRAIRDAATHYRNPDRRAQAESIEWERYGDFLLATGSRAGAVKALREAAVCCLGDPRYGHDRRRQPCRLLRLRLRSLTERAAAICGGDKRLQALLTADPRIRKACPDTPEQA